MTNKPYCIDIYQGDDVLDMPGRPCGGFALAKAAGIVFMDHKASEGLGEVDRRCAFRRPIWMDGKAYPVTDVDGTVLNLTPRFGFYHFNGTGPASAEAAHFIATVKSAGYSAGDDLCLDWEDIGASGHQQSATWADAFCSAVEDWCGFPIKVYGGDAPLEQLRRTSSDIVERFTKRRFWFCQYGIYAPGLLPLPWTHAGPFMWQDDGDHFGPGPHTIPGIERYCDNSTVVAGMTVARLAAGWAGGTAVVA